MAGEPDESQAHDTPPIEDPTLTGAEPGEGEGSPEQNEAEAQQRDRARLIPADVMVRELTPLRQRNRELENMLNEHRRRLNEADELIKRLNGGRNGEPDPNRSPVNSNVPTDQDIEARAAALNFQRDAVRVSQAGITAYGQQVWDGACRLMEGLGLNTPEFVSTCMEVVGTERTHEVFQAIAEDPERAARIASMPPVRRIAEVSRISEQMANKTTQAPKGDPKPAQRTVSRAPEPAPRVTAGSRTAKDWRSDETTDEEFSKAWDEHMKNRAGVRR